MKLIENELGRSLDGTRAGPRSHIRQTHMRALERRMARSTRDQAIALLGDLGVDIGLFEWAVPEEAASAA
jgi:hypothetical protein